MSSVKQYGVGEDISLLVQIRRGDESVPIKNVKAIELEGEVAGIEIDIGLDKPLGLSIFICDADSKQYVINDKKVLIFSSGDKKFIMDNGCVLFKVHTYFKTRDWENQNSATNIFGPLKRSFVFCYELNDLHFFGSKKFQVVSMVQKRKNLKKEKTNTNKMELCYVLNNRKDVSFSVNILYKC